MRTVTVIQNQSMLDMIIQGTGSLEAGMQFCIDNGVSISDVPAVSKVLNVTDNAIAVAGTAGAGVVTYLAKNGTINNGVISPLQIGTLNLQPAVITEEYVDQAAEVYTDENGNVYVPE